MWIRYFAQVDLSDIGKVALEYCRSLVRIAPVRLVPHHPMLDDLPGPWRAFAGCFMTPTDGPFVNCVCTRPERWAWEQVIAMPTQDIPNPSSMVGGPMETIKSTFELYTFGVRNTLFLTSIPGDPVQLATAAKYESVVTPDQDLHDTWNAADPSRPAWLVPVPVRDHIRLAAAVRGS